MSKGSLYALGAYLIWGFFPIYFRLLEQAPAIQIVAHRILWSFILLAILLATRKEWKTLRRAITGPKMLAIFMIASILLTLNWLIYIFGVQAGFIVETSLGYYINPLVSVLLGVVFLRERLRPLQWAAVGLATLGVLYLAIDYGRIPWIALSLAMTFGLYGLAKKTSPLGSFYSLSMETGLMFIPSVIFLLFLQTQGTERIRSQQHADDGPADAHRPGDGGASVAIWSGGAQDQPDHAGADAIYRADHAVFDRRMAL